MEKVSLFDEFKKGGYDSSIITTFNAYFPFYEDVLLRRMRSCGIHHNTVLIDAGQCQQAMEQSYPLLAGRHYTLAPMDCKAAFHPKIIMLLGKRKGLLAVGSHNLTFSGYGTNAEITNVIRFNLGKDEETSSLFFQAWTAIQTWLDDYGESLSDAIKKSVNSSVDGVDWLVSPGNDESDVQLFFSSSSTDPLWHQVEPWIPAKPKRCSVIGAFFDKRLQFLDVFQNDVQPEEYLIGIQPSTVGVSTSIFKRKDLRVVNSESMFEDQDKEFNSYIHAKSIYVEDKQQPVLISGSANPSAPAWLLKGDRCNAEAVLVRLDSKVIEAAKALGFDRLNSANHVKTVGSGSVNTDESNVNLSSLELVNAVVHQNTLSFSFLCETKNITLFLENSKRDILEKNELKKGEINHSVKLKKNVFQLVARGTIRKGNKVLAQLLLHFLDEIDAITAKGTKRKFRYALGSLGTESPELKLLFNSIDKIIFEERKSPKSITRGLSHVDHTSTTTTTNDGKQKLVIEWAGASGLTRNKPKRLNVNDDLANLLDVFVYGLGYEKLEVRAFSGEDEFGRNEEELIGTDDDTDDRHKLDQKLVLSNEEKLKLCHRRLKRIANNMSKGLVFLQKGQISHIDVLPKLLAVLSLFKELHQRSRGFDWMGKNDRMLQEKMLESLFANICESWWGKSYGLMKKKDDTDQNLNDVDELVRLRGLLVWMSWYVGIKYDLKPCFSETIQDRNQRLWRNAIYVLLAHLVDSDEMIEDEATRICGTESEECLKWFKDLSILAKHLGRTCRHTMNKLNMLPSPSEPGWVMHRNGGFNGLRYCYDASEGDVRFACVSKIGEFRSFKKPEKIAAIGKDLRLY